MARYTGDLAHPVTTSCLIGAADQHIVDLAKKEFVNGCLLVLRVIACLRVFLDFLSIGQACFAVVTST